MCILNAFCRFYRIHIAFFALLSVILSGCGQNPLTADPEIIPHPVTASSEPAVSALPIVPEQPVTSTPLPTLTPPTRPIYVVDPNDQGLLSNIFMIDPDAERIVWRLETRFLPEAALSPDGQRLYVVDSYRTRVTRGEQRDVLSIYDALSGELIIEDMPVQGRLQYKGWPSGAYPFIFTSDDGRQLYIGKYGDPDNGKTRLTIYDPKTLQLVNEVNWPSCGRRIRTLPEKWLCAITSTALENSPSAMTFSLDTFDPLQGTIVETLFSIADLPMAGVVPSAAESRLYVVTSDLTLLILDMQNGTILETTQLKQNTGWELVGDSMTLSPDGTRLYVGFDSGKDENSVFTDAISVYDATNWGLVTTVNLPNSINFFSLSTVGDQLYVVSPPGQNLTIYNTDTFQEIAVLNDLGGNPAAILAPSTTQ